jgi:hypothetical protein
MVTLTSLWLPIVVAAIGVFLISFVIHMILPYHRSNVEGVADEKAFRDAIGSMKIPPGDYMVPHCKSPKEMNSEEFQNKLKEGPVLSMTVLANGPFAMGKRLAQWFVYSLLVGFFAAYIASLTIPANAEYLTVMRVVGAAAFLGYGFALIQDSIWWSRKWTTTFKFLLDAFVYALITGGVFGWLWPAA